MTSITSAISAKNNLYNGAPVAMMSKATEYGDHVHDVVEDILKTARDTGQLVIPSYVNPVSHIRSAAAKAIKLIIKHQIQPIEIEQAINWRTDITETWSTRSDVMGWIDGAPALMDIKATKNLDKDSAQLQLSAYAYAYQAKHGILISNLYVMWLSKEKYGRLEKLELLPYETVLASLRAGKIKINFGDSGFNPATWQNGNCFM